MDVIFQSEKVLKKDLFPRMISLMESAGWVDVSSRPSTDFIVMKSSGISGDKELCFQIRPTDRSNRNDVTTTSNNMFSIRLIRDYVSNVIGQSGSTTRSNETWYNVRLARTNYPLEDVFTLYYYVDKNKGVFVFEPPDSPHNTSEFFYIGLPTSFINENKNSGLITFATYLRSTSSLSDRALVTDNPYVLYKNSYNLNLYTDSLGFNNPSYSTFYLNEINYGNHTEGIRGRVDELYTIRNNSKFVDGDIVKLNEKKYKMFHIPSTSYGFSSTSGFAIRVE